MKVITTQQFPSPTFDDDDGLADIRAIAGDVSSSVKKKSDTKTKKKKMASVKRRDRKRRRFSFWLEGNKSDQIGLMKWINELKHQRQFVTVIRFALWLYQDLLAGRTDMLYETFPHLIPPTPAPSVPPEKIKEMEDELKKLRKEHDVLEGQVEILNRVICNLSLPAAIDTAVKMAGQGAPKPLAMTAAPMPAYDDDDTLVIRKDESSGQRAAENFIKSAFALNGMSYDGGKQ